MIAWLLANWKLVLFGLILAALGIQTARLNVNQAEFAKYKAEIQKEVAENKAKAALEQARMAHNAQESLDALSLRLSHVNAAYRLLRDSRSSQPVPSLSDSLGIAQACPGESGKPNPVTRNVDALEGGIEKIIEFGDSEIAKLVELYQLEQRNAGK